MLPATHILIVGFGDIGERVAMRLVGRYRISALVRDPDGASRARARGVRPVVGDLSKLATLGRLPAADVLLHFAPPPAMGERDRHTRFLLAAAGRWGMLSQGMPRHLVYISTTGVYGDCGGAWIDETRPVRPISARARRRVDAESALRRWGARNQVAVSILRVPGIYALDRLPLERLRKGTPALRADDDVFTNHIHADDLARAVVATLRHGRPGRTYNVVDDSTMKMGDYFDAVADRYGLPRSPRVSRDEARRMLPEALLSFMSESRRIDNRRLKQELRFRLAYPTVADFLAEPDGAARIRDGIGPR